MLLGGALGGPWLQMAQEIALAVGDGEKLRVLPVAGEGSKQNLRDVLFVRGVDLGITRLQILNEAKASGEFGPNLDRRIAYIAELAVDMLQVLAREDIASLTDLGGKRINVFPKDNVVPAVLKALGVEIEVVHVPLADAIEQMRAGKLAATACFCSVPIPAYRGVSADLGFKLLDVPYTEALEESYLPASLTAESYPNLIAQGKKVLTVGSNVVLISYNWAPGTDRYRKIERFAISFFTNFDKLRQPSRHETWRSVNPAATIRGWQRFPAAEEWLERRAEEAKAAAPAADPVLARAKDSSSAGGEPTEKDRLFKEFLEWSRKKGKR
jgi:TRAP-type uncharacterized transport system substrate-binding protein